MNRATAQQRSAAGLLCAALAAASGAGAADPGNVLRAVKSGLGQDDVLLRFAAAPSLPVHVYRDPDKTRIGATVLAMDVSATTYTDPGAVPPAAGMRLFYELQETTGTCPTCPLYESPRTAGAVAEPAITETSGIAASLDHPGVLYLHNDSGDSARFFAVSDTGAALGELVLNGSPTARDWEGMSLGPCPAGRCVFIGDIGDNGASRSEYAVFRVDEPVVEVTAPIGTVMVDYERYPYVYPDGSHNAETLLVHPLTGDVYVITKGGRTTPARVYKMAAPLDPMTTATLEYLADLPLPEFIPPPLPEDQVTGGDIHPCDSRLVLRTYAGIYEFRTPTTMPFESVFTTADWNRVVYPDPRGQLQWEAVGWTGDGLGYVTVHEGSGPDIDVAGCQ